MAAGRVLSVSSRAILRASEALGIDTEPLLDAAGLERRAVEDPDAHIDAERQAALWSEAARVAGPGIGLRAAERVPFGVYKVVEYLTWSSSTVGEAMGLVARYFPVLTTASELRVIPGDPVLVRLEPRGSARPGPPSYIEYVLAILVVRMREATADAWPLERVDFAHAAPGDDAEHRRIFASPVAFDSDHSQLAISKRAWDAPVPTADPDLFRVLEGHAERRLASTYAEPTAEIRHAIARELRGGHPTLEVVAKRLGFSARSLQRRLRDQGATFAALLDGERRRLAIAYLAQPGISLWEVSHLLGFAEQSSFQRAFKRWTGQTPRAYRDAARDGA